MLGEQIVCQLFCYPFQSNIIHGCLAMFLFRELTLQVKEQLIRQVYELAVWCSIYGVFLFLLFTYVHMIL